MVSSLDGGGFVRELLIVSGLVGVQVAFAVYVVLMNRVLALGVDPLFIVIVGSLIQSVFLLPFALVIERKKWPARLSPALMLQFVLIAFGGVTAFQGLMLMGIKRTSPTIASAMPNLAPGMIFIIAAIFRFERFELRCNYTRAKVLGTLVCLSGTIAMSFFQSPPSTTSVTHKVDLVGTSTYQDWIIGCFCILSGVVILSCNTVLQGGLVTSICVSFQTWCVNQKGPVMVSIFSPIQTISSTLLSAIFLGQFINLASFAGMIVMFIGLYIVLWAKKKESCHFVDVDGISTLHKHDIETPLLS